MNDACARAVPDRVVPLHGVVNLRDVGGLAAARGKTRGGRVFRSEFLDPASVDLELVRDRLGLVSVLDLRRQAEHAAPESPWSALGVRSERVPLRLNGDGTPWSAPYWGYLDSDPRGFARAMTFMMTGANHPVLVHCAAGKDRTGTVIAVLLDVLGVDRELIVEDHLRSAEGIAVIIDRLRSDPAYRDVLAAVDDESHLPKAAKVTELFAWLDARGGSRAWLTEQGVPSQIIAAAHAALIE